MACKVRTASTFCWSVSAKRDLWDGADTPSSEPVGNKAVGCLPLCHGSTARRASSTLGGLPESVDHQLW